MNEIATPDFDTLLDYLKGSRGFEFNAYKRPSLIRRVRKRMEAISLDRFDEYTDYLEVHPEEFARLFDVILINVTSFFRDEQAWQSIRDAVVPHLTAGRTSPIRVWTAGCASGEETYSIAMILTEALGREQFRARVKIYATDVDDDVLNQARAASYNERQVAALPKPLLESYFVRDGDRYVFDKDLRRSVIFGHHDLIQDAPISRINLLICRNTLMYFNIEAQSRILARFHFALADGGVLFLGKAEMLLTHSPLFAPIDLRRRIFRKVPQDNWRERIAIINRASGDDGLAGDRNTHMLYSAALDASPHAQFVIDTNGLLAMYNERAAALFALTAGDVGRRIQDLELSYRPLELRSLVGEALDERRSVALRDFRWEVPDREARYYDVLITPLSDEGGHSMGVSIAFVDVSKTQDLQAQLNRSKQDLETAYEELQSTNEELETTNEELQSTVEELETTNEELQSTNEELETMNEELQSTNEELQTLNQELQDRSDELKRANGFLGSVLGGVRSGVAVLDRELRVIAWNPRAEDLWGVRDSEARGQNFFNLDIGLPIEQLRSGIRTCLSSEHEYTELIVAATNRRGKIISCKVVMTPLKGAANEIHGVILLMDEQMAARVN